MDNFISFYRWGLADDPCLQGDGAGRVGIVAGNDFDLDPSLIDFLKHFLYALFGWVIKHGQAQKMKRQILLFGGKAVPFKSAFGHAQYPIALLPKALNLLSKPVLLFF